MVALPPRRRPPPDGAHAQARPQSAPDQQDKRSVIPIDFADVDTWLHGSTEDIQSLIRVPPAEAFDAGPDK
jgi:hypothetical protein